MIQIFFKVQVDESEEKTKCKTPQYSSPTMSVLDQAQQQNNVVFNPSKMDLNASMSLSYSLNNLSCSEPSAAASNTAAAPEPLNETQPIKKSMPVSYETPVISVVKEQDTALAQTMLNMIIPTLGTNTLVSEEPAKEPETVKESRQEKQAVPLQEFKAEPTIRVPEIVASETVTPSAIPSANKNLGNYSFSSLVFKVGDRYFGVGLGLWSGTQT